MNCCKMLFNNLLQAILCFTAVVTFSYSYPLRYSNNVPHRPYSAGIYSRGPLNEPPLIYSPQSSNYYNEKYPSLSAAKFQSGFPFQEGYLPRYVDPLTVQEELASLAAAEETPDYVGDEYVDDSPNDVLYDEKWLDGPVERQEERENSWSSNGSPPQMTDAALADLMISYFLNSLENKALQGSGKESESLPSSEERLNSEKKKRDEPRASTVGPSTSTSTTTPATTQQSSTQPKTVTSKSSESAFSRGKDLKIATRGQKEYPMFRQANRQDRLDAIEESTHSKTQVNWPSKLDRILEAEDEESLKDLKNMKRSSKRAMTRNTRDVLASELKSLRKKPRKN